MRRRLVLAVALVAAASVTLFAVPLGAELRRTYRDEELVRLQRDTVEDTRQIDLSRTRADPIELPREEDRVAVYDRTGRRRAGAGPPRAPRLVREAVRTGRIAADRGGDALVVAVPLLAGEHVAGAVLAARDPGVVDARVRRAWLALAALGLGVVGVAVLAALAVGRWLAGPLERLAGAARRLGDGDFGVRAPRAGIAELDAVGGALDTTAERLAALVARERAFTADASHQLRTPLAALRLELEAMELRAGTGTEAARALAQVDRLQETIDTLLSVARDRPRTREELDLRALLTGVEERWRGPLAAQGRPLRVGGADGAPRVRASEPVVREILDVLIDNACRHGAGAVTVRTRAAGGGVAVDVGDEGPGFAGDPEAAFARRAGDGGGGGHGIGLALARSLAQAEGARLVVRRPGPEPVLTLLLAGD